MSPQLLDLVESALRRPAMNTPPGTFREVVAFLEGFISGQASAGVPIDDWRAFEEWLACGASALPQGGTRDVLLSSATSSTQLLRKLVEFRSSSHAESRRADAEAADAITVSSERLIGALRPFSGQLPHEQFHSLVRSLRIVAPSLARQSHLHRTTVSALWGACDLIRRWALDSGSMLDRNGLLSAEDRRSLSGWHDALSYAVMMLLDGQDPAEAFVELDALLARMSKREDR